MNVPYDRETKLGRLRIAALTQIDELKKLLSDLHSTYDFDVQSASVSLDYTSRRFVQESSYNAHKIDGQSGRTDAVLSDLKDQISSLALIGSGATRHPLAKLRPSDLLDHYNNLIVHIHHYRAELSKTHEGNSFDVPEERAAPLRVRTRDETLQIVDRSTHVGTLTAPSIERIRQAIIEILNNSFDVLGYSHNVDPRFVPSCKPFLRHLERPLADMSVEALGFNWQIFGDLISQNREALPISVLSQLDQAHKSTSVLLSQFEEWRAYLSAQTITDISEEQLNDVVAAADEIINDIFSASNVADEEIGDRLIEITAPVTAGIISSQAIAAPLIDSLANLFAQICATTVERSPWISGTMEHVKDCLEKPFKQGLIFFALYMTATYAPRFSNIPLFKFMSDAHTLALKQFPWAKDTIPK